MGQILLYVGVAACFVTLAVLAFGIRGFGTSKMTPQRQNVLMRWRIGMQFAAVILIALAVWLTKES